MVKKTLIYYLEKFFLANVKIPSINEVPKILVKLRDKFDAATIEKPDYEDGVLMGTDANGNKYYQSKKFYFLRTRWAIREKDVMTNKLGRIPFEWDLWLNFELRNPPDKKNPLPLLTTIGYLKSPSQLLNLGKVRRVPRKDINK